MFMIKRIFGFVLSFALITTIFLCACENERNEDGGHKKEPSRFEGEVSRREESVPENNRMKAKDTVEFYELVNESETFWFEMEITADGETYSYIQARNGKSITTVINRKNNAEDRYEIAEFKDGMVNVHTLNFIEKKYDTIVTTNSQTFLFGDENPESFANPDQKGDLQKKEKTYYCEKFNVASVENGEIDGYNAYYFDEGCLSLIEIVENGNLTMSMHLISYGSEIPDHIYLTPPADFSKGTIEIDTTIDFGSLDWFE